MENQFILLFSVVEYKEEVREQEMDVDVGLSPALSECAPALSDDSDEEDVTNVKKSKTSHKKHSQSKTIKSESPQQ